MYSELISFSQLENEFVKLFKEVIVFSKVTSQDVKHAIQSKLDYELVEKIIDFCDEVPVLESDL